jgi:tRNA wybutosine-synthesizing protein 4
MRRKRQIVLENPELRGALGTVELSDESPVLLKSDRYCQIGCDLSELGILEQSLFSLADVSSCRFFFLAEVSITYMETQAADALIRWAGSFDPCESCKFCHPTMFLTHSSRILSPRTDTPRQF